MRHPLTVAQEHVYISSSAVRELLKFGQDISDYVPNAVLRGVKQQQKNQMALISHYWAIITYRLQCPALLYRGARNVRRYLRKVLQVNKPTWTKSEGSYHLDGWELSTLDWLTLVYAWLTPYGHTQCQRDDGGLLDAEFMRINQFYMETSQTWPNIKV